MNNNASTVIGLGALGTLIAYYGYQYFDEDDDNNDTDESQDKEITNNNETPNMLNKNM